MANQVACAATLIPLNHYLVFAVRSSDPQISGGIAGLTRRVYYSREEWTWRDGWWPSEGVLWRRQAAHLSLIRFRGVLGLPLVAWFVYLAEPLSWPVAVGTCACGNEAAAASARQTNYFRTEFLKWIF